MTHRPDGEPYDPPRRIHPGAPVTTPGRGIRRLIVLVAAVGWFWLLRDFTDTPIAVLLSAVGVVLAYGGTYLALAGARNAFESFWYVGACGVGLLMLAGAAATLAPAAPDDLLVRIAQGWNVLESRTERLAEAIEADDVARAGKLAARGLGDPAALDGNGDPLLHRARSAAMVDALLAAGLDPDAVDATGRTLLMRTSDPELARALLAGGADPDAQDDSAVTALTQGRGDWLVANPSPAGRADATAVSWLGDPLLPGDVGSVSIVVDNPGTTDRVVDLRAVLDNGVLFVAASHEGGVETRGPPGPVSTVRWPLLSLPAGGQGRLEMQVIARPDQAVPGLRAGDLGIDVTVIDLPERSERVLQLYQQRAGAPARRAASDPWAYAGVLVVAVSVFALWLLYRFRARGDSNAERRYRFGRMVAGASAILCAAIAIGLGWSIVEPYARFEDASCEILDRRALATEVETTRMDRRLRRRFTLQAHPLAAVAIDTGAERVVAAGWSTGAATRSVHELQAVSIGSTLPCWIDPADARRFTLIRTPTLSGVIGLALLLGLASGLGLVATRLGLSSDAAGE